MFKAVGKVPLSWHFEVFKVNKKTLAQVCSKFFLFTLFGAAFVQLIGKDKTASFNAILVH